MSHTLRARLVAMGQGSGLWRIDEGAVMLSTLFYRIQRTTPRCGCGLRRCSTGLGRVAYPSASRRLVASLGGLLQRFTHALGAIAKEAPLQRLRVGH